MAHLERRRNYPAGARSRREEGIVHVRFRVAVDGTVSGATLVRSSGHAELDREALSLVARASPLPPPPSGAPVNVTAPVRFRLR
jgi:protein TonB